MAIESEVSLPQGITQEERTGWVSIRCPKDQVYRITAGREMRKTDKATGTVLSTDLHYAEIPQLADAEFLATTVTLDDGTTLSMLQLCEAIQKRCDKMATDYAAAKAGA